MKEATGELNMTVVTVVAIAALVAFFYLFIWPTIQTSMTLNSACSSAGTTGGTTTLKDGTQIICAKNTSGQMSCGYTDANGKAQSKICD